MRNSIKKAIITIAADVIVGAKAEGKEISEVVEILESAIEVRPELLKSISMELYKEFLTENELQENVCWDVWRKSKYVQKQLARNEALGVCDYKLNAVALELMSQYQECKQMLSNDIISCYKNTQSSEAIAKRAYANELENQNDSENSTQCNMIPEENYNSDYIEDYSYLVDKLDNQISKLNKYAVQERAKLEKEKAELCEFINSHPELCAPNDKARTYSALNRIARAQAKNDEKKVNESLQVIEQIKANRAPKSEQELKLEKLAEAILALI